MFLIWTLILFLLFSTDRRVFAMYTNNVCFFLCHLSSLTIFRLFSYGNSIASWYTLIKYLCFFLYHFVRECFRGTCFCHQNYFYVQFIHFLCGLEFRAYTLYLCCGFNILFLMGCFIVFDECLCVCICVLHSWCPSIYIHSGVRIKWYMHIFGVNFGTKYAYNSNWKANEISTRVA